MKMHKLEIYVIDFFDYGIEEVADIVKDSLDCGVKVAIKGTTDIGDWHDGHELNQRSTPGDACEKYFNK